MEGNDLTKVARSSDLLKERLLHLMPNAGKYPTAIKGLSMVRREQAHQTESCFYRDQGVSLRGKPVHDCRGMPCMFTITKASARQPFLAVSLNLDKSLLARLAREIGLPMNSGSAQGVAV